MATVSANGSVQMGVSRVSRGRSAVHFYYSPPERLRYLDFLLEGFREGEATVVGCARDGHRPLTEGGLRLLPGPGVMRLELSHDPAHNLQSIVTAMHDALRFRRPGRMLLDFGRLVAMERISEQEGLLSALTGVSGMTVLSQYDGGRVSAAVAIEQFNLHALTIVGNALYHENQRLMAPLWPYQAVQR